MIRLFKIGAGVASLFVATAAFAASPTARIPGLTACPRLARRTGWPMPEW